MEIPTARRVLYWKRACMCVSLCVLFLRDFPSTFLRREKLHDDAIDFASGRAIR